MIRGLGSGALLWSRAELGPHLATFLGVPVTEGWAESTQSITAPLFSGFCMGPGCTLCRKGGVPHFSCVAGAR